MLSMRTMFSTDAMRSLWTDAALYAAMLRFEAALADAQARCDMIPSQAAKCIAQVCAQPEAFDWASIAANARQAGTTAIPLIRALKQEVIRIAPQYACFVHYGSTSQDVCETALVLQCQVALRRIYAQMVTLGDAFGDLVQTHLRTEMLARTLMQAAAPISFGWKVACWLDALARCAMALQDAGQACRVIQFGGANGARAAHGAQAEAVACALADTLGLDSTPVAWHSARDRLVRLGNELALCCAMLGKLGRDISLLMQSEVAEAFEPSDAARGGSSAMPHKRNPTACMHMLDAALRAPPLALTLVSDMNAEHERGLGSWPNALPLLADLFLLLDNALSMAVQTMQGLRVDPEAMRVNLARQNGVVHSERVNMLLSRELGAVAAQRIVDAACRQASAQGVDLLILLRQHPQVDGKIASAALEDACSVAQCLEAGQFQCQQVLAAWSDQRASLQVDVDRMGEKFS